MPRHAVPEAMPEAVGDDSQVTGIGALSDRRRRALYNYVVAQPTPVNRDDAAVGAGVARHVAKFHLDKLVAHGLLSVEYARPAGRGGPGAGRPAKVYRRSSRQLAISLPPRDYEVVGRLLAAAVTDAQDRGISLDDALREAAQTTGLAYGQHARARLETSPDHAALLGAAQVLLGELGYEPRLEGEDVSLINCPFHGLAQDYTDLVCGMNLDLMIGVLEGLGLADVKAHLAPTDGRCCVQFRSNNQGSAAVRFRKEE
jgi:predicted ArsR family transcriptional regulator